MTRPIVHNLRDLPDQQYVVTIGSFDGVHRGHQFLLERVAQSASGHGVSSLAITFDPLPAEVLRPDKAPPRLCTTDERTRQIQACGIEHVAVLRFDTGLAQQTAEEFLDEVVSTARPVAVIVGEDFAFGRNRQGTPEFLAERASDKGFALEVVQRVNPDGLELSSSSVRQALAAQGDVAMARAVLGRHFRLTGHVHNGDHRGRELGYPTANLHLTDRLIVPADGIYAALTSGNSIGNEHPALVYVGTRPTFGQSPRIVEAFLLDYSGDLYGQQISVDFVDRIRGDRAFDSAEELVEQMKLDESAGREIFVRHGIAVAASDS